MFRLRRGAGEVFDRFLDGGGRDTVAAILPGPDALSDLARKQPGTKWQPVPLRSFKHMCGGTKYALGLQ